MTEYIKPVSHILLLGGEKFPVFHKNRRLYSFIDWKESREKLIKIMLKMIKIKTGEDSAFIFFKMANPMRKTRLGNFFLDLDADIIVKGKSIGTLEELGMKNIFIDSFETMDLSELEMRSNKETIFSEMQYEAELEMRINNFYDHKNIDMLYFIHSKEYLKSHLMELMKKEGWRRNSDNRLSARNRRKVTTKIL